MRLIPEFGGCSVLVVGDVMLDRYWYGDTARISPEAPVPVVRIGHREDRAGGAANVATNLAVLGARARVIGVVGEDEAAAALEARLRDSGIDCDFTRSSTHPTVTKLRVMSRNQQLIRLDFEQSSGAIADKAAIGGLAQRTQAALGGAHVLVLSDYGKGALGDAAVLIEAARATGKPVLVDPKGNDWERYRGATLLTPNVAELEMVAGPCRTESMLVEQGASLCEKLSLGALLVTRSEHGMTLIERGREPLHLPAEAREVFDVTGAGDTVIALVAAAVAAGQPLAAAARLANLGAGLVVGKSGTAAVSASELHRALRARDRHEGGVVDQATLMAYVREARAQGETLVMTNGCFDLLHPGHIRYLQAARRLGDRLVVAVNDDASVRRLKGERRPVNPLASRMQVLAALGCVDWVVPFSEDTPQRLICQVLPDVLVKGGDYQPDAIAGAECVQRAGGEVRVLEYHEGFSTTRLIDAMGKA